MKVLFLVAEFPKLSETFILNQIIHLKKQGHTVFVSALGDPGEETTHPRARELKREVVYPPFWAKKFLRPLYFAFKFRDKKIDVIHAHFGFAGNVGWMVKKLLKIPLVTSFYGIDASPTRFSPSHYRCLFKVGDLFLALSEDMKRDLVRLGCPEEKIRIQHLGVDLDEVSNFKFQISKSISDTKTILSVGRLVEKKGFDDLLRALELVLNEVPDVELRIIGGGQLKEELENLVNRLGIGERVKFLGPQPYEVVLRELSRVKVFALASHTSAGGDKEGTPVVLMDAQAMGVPVVSTKHAGIPEVVVDGKTGILVEERDVEGLSNALIKILEDPELGRRFGEEGRKHIRESYNLEAQVKKLVEIYCELKR